jgi:hypothetical protein
MNLISAVPSFAKHLHPDPFNLLAVIERQSRFDNLATLVREST